MASQGVQLYIHFGLYTVSHLSTFPKLVYSKYKRYMNVTCLGEMSYIKW